MAADTLFTGGSVFTGSGLPRSNYAVAVTNGRIAGVGPEHSLQHLIGPDTERRGLDGALLSPGFQDAHIHPVIGGVELLQCNLTEAENADQTIASIDEYSKANPDEPWILGGGWTMSHFVGGAPTRTLLDAVVPDRPALLLSRDHHSVWANTAAIHLAGLTAQTEDPQDGRIEREPDGFPAGTFHEGAERLFGEVRPAPTDDLAYRGLLRAQELLLSFGITGWQDALIGGNELGVGTLAAYREALKENALKVHVVGSQWWARESGLEQVSGLLERRDEWASTTDTRRFNLGTVKIMLDGVAENYTASMLEPYRDASGKNTCNHGVSFVDGALLKEAVTALDAAGMQVHFHALGDRAVRDALDAIEAARRANGPSDGRHHLAHLQLVDEDDCARFAALDAIANIQALWAAHEEEIDTLTLPFLQPDAVSRHYPFGDLHRENARLAAGSDWPVSSANPLDAIHIAVNRVTPGDDAPPLAGAEQRLDLETAFTAYTSGSAYLNHREHDTGYLHDGYLANLAVISPNPFELASEDIHRAQVTETWIEGERVYSRTDSA